ncbi:MAG: DUF4118 domain-containing protein [Candidatus Obscuribacterales bacterium]|nr:DUF4118 domain-containing protein [Candidatus Obscuribacterales bacterium]
MNHKNRLRYLYTLMLIGAATLIAKLLVPHFAAANLVMVYLMAVVLVATKFGKGPAILASVMSVCIFDFFCIPPYLTFAVSDSQYLLTFGVMLTTALVISNLAATAHDQAERATKKEHQTSLLYSFSRELAEGRDLNALAEIARRHIGELIEAKVDVLVSNTGETPSQSTDNFKISQATKTIPLRSSNTNAAPLGSVCFPDGLTHCDGERLSTLEAFISQLATACERSRLSEENEQARVQVKSEQLRSSLLSSISHDLRTPLATITGAASGIMEAGDKVNLNECKELAAEIFNESRRLNRLVGNLLDMTRVESGALEIKKEPQPVDEVIGAAISYFEEQLESRSVETEIPDDLPMISGDAVLLQQLMINLLENALKYTPPGSPLLFKAKPAEDNAEFITIEVSDRGPGIPEEMRWQIFQKFVRAKSRSSAGGAGLGLAICQGIVEAHGGKLGVSERAGGGATFWFTLPVDNSDSLPDKPKETIALEA